MNFEKIKDGFEIATQLSPLEILYNKLPINSLNGFNEPLDMYSLYARNAPSDRLSPQQTDELREKNDWPDSILDNIRTKDEAIIYSDANLKVENIEGKDSLIRTDIDYNQEVDGQTNLERMKQGKCPISYDGQNIELHHIGQNPNASLAELTTTEHRGTKNDMTLHDKTEESKIDRVSFRTERENYWRARAEQIENQRNG